MLRALLILLTASPVFAQPSTVSPAELSEDELPPPPYPRELVLRPMLMPDGVVDVAAALRAVNDASSHFEPALRIGTSVGEITAGMNFQLSDEPRNDTQIRELSIGYMREVIPCRIPELVVGARIIGRDLPGDRPGWSPLALVGYKHRLAPWFALVPTGHVGYRLDQAYDADLDLEQGTHALFGGVEVKGQLQAGSYVAFELGLGSHYLGYLDDNRNIGLDSHSTQTLSLMVLLSAGANVDLSAGYLRSMRSFEFEHDVLLLAMNVRRVP